METSKPRIELGLRDERAEVGDHIAYFWEDDSEFRDGVRFLEVGLDEGDFCVVFGYDAGNQRVLSTLDNHGYDTAGLIAGQRLVVLGGHADAGTMLGNIGAVFTEAIKRGAKLIRLLGNIGWGHSGWPDETDIMEFEARVTGAAKLFPCVVVCMYDVTKLPGNVVLHGAFETHPMTIAGNVTRENPHFLELEEFLKRIKARESSTSR